MAELSDSGSDSYDSGESDSSFDDDFEEEMHVLQNQLRVARTQQASLQQQQQRPAANSTNDSVALILTEATDSFGMSIVRAFCERCQVHTAILLGKQADALHAAGQQVKAQSPSTRLVHHAIDVGLLLLLVNNSSSNGDQQQQQQNDVEALMNMVFVQLFAPQRFGRLVFVNNAGLEQARTSSSSSSSTPSLQELRRSVDLMVTSSFWLTQRFQRFLEQNGGHASATCVSVTLASHPDDENDDDGMDAVRSGMHSARRAFHARIALQQDSMRVLNYVVPRRLVDEPDIVVSNAASRALVEHVVTNQFTNGEAIEYQR